MPALTTIRVRRAPRPHFLCRGARRAPLGKNAPRNVGGRLVDLCREHGTVSTLPSADLSRGHRPRTRDEAGYHGQLRRSNGPRAASSGRPADAARFIAGPHPGQVPLTACQRRRTRPAGPGESRREPPLGREASTSSKWTRRAAGGVDDARELIGCAAFCPQARDRYKIWSSTRPTWSRIRGSNAPLKLWSIPRRTSSSPYLLRFEPEKVIGRSARAPPLPFPGSSRRRPSKLHGG